MFQCVNIVLSLITPICHMDYVSYSLYLFQTMAVFSLDTCIISSFYLIYPYKTMAVIGRSLDNHIFCSCFFLFTLSRQQLCCHLTTSSLVYSSSFTLYHSKQWCNSVVIEHPYLPHIFFSFTISKQQPSMQLSSYHSLSCCHIITHKNIVKIWT